MATTSDNKYRINALAKDLNVKSKDIIDLLAAHGMGNKSHMTALEGPELSIVFEYYTQQNQIDITAFFKSYQDKIDAKKAEEQAKRDADEKRKADEKAAAKAEKQKKLQEQAIKQGKPIPQQQPQKQKVRGEVRVVDTRGTASVDLSKYDEKYDNLAGNVASVAGGKQKLKKKNNNNNNNNNNRNMQERRPNDKGKAQQKQQQKPKPVQLSITVPDEITVAELASRMKTAAGEVIKKLMLMGVMASVNEVIDYDTAYLIADEFGIKVTKEVVVTIEEKLFTEEEDKAEDLVPRAPVIVVMGHVDHGKTSLLDAIRDTHVTAGEAGGITQHIGAYSVKIGDKPITFLDTPGHEAFTSMRARGANLTDIAVLVVAADDGIMPQTIEAINHAKAAGVSIIVAINKMDRPAADPDRVKQELTNYDLLPEEWGGDTIVVPVSALKRQGIDELLEMITLSADMMELTANPSRAAQGAVIEAKLDKGRGPVATVLVQNGTLRIGDYIIAGSTVGRIRSMTNDKGEKVKEAGPSTPVEVMGLSEVPAAGDSFRAVSDERLAKELVEQRKTKEKEEQFKAEAKANLEDLFSQIGSGVKTLNLIVKADVQGTAEAVKASLARLSNEEVKVSVIHAATGAINESDVMLASASNAIIIGFNIRPDRVALDMATRDKVDVRTYRVIYECIDEVTAAMKGMLAPKFREVILGRAEVRQTIRVPNVGTIAGSYVTDGKVTRNASIRVLRSGEIIYEDKISSLKRFKDDAKEVLQSFECGIGLEKFNDIKVGDVLEAYTMEEVER